MTEWTSYKHYTIRSRPLDFTGTEFQRNGYKVRIDISWNITDAIGVMAECLQDQPLYATESEADVAGLAFGRRLIDEGNFGKSG